jgi:hypothetical protein
MGLVGKRGPLVTVRTLFQRPDHPEILLWFIDANLCGKKSVLNTTGTMSGREAL